MERLNQLLKRYKIEIVCNNCGSPNNKIQKKKSKVSKRIHQSKVAPQTLSPAFTRLSGNKSNNQGQSDLKELFTF